MGMAYSNIYKWTHKNPYEKATDKKNNSDLDYYKQKQKEFNQKYNNYINK